MKSIALCYSKRYKEQGSQLAQELRNNNILVFEPNLKEPLNEDSLVHSPHMTKVVFKGLTLEHFDWIRKADTIYVLNLNDYVGVSVTMEMGYAAALGKPVFAHSQETGDPCRNALIDQVIPEVKQLIQILK